MINVDILKKKWYESHKENCAEWNFETLSYLQLTRGYGGINKNVMYINWNTNKAFMWKKMKRTFFLKTIFSGGKTVHWNKGWFYHMYNVGKERMGYNNLNSWTLTHYIFSPLLNQERTANLLDTGNYFQSWTNLQWRI